MEGKAIIFSAPSGSGKTTIVKHLLKKNSDQYIKNTEKTRENRGITETKYK
jgi:guanylate kinase